MKVIIETDENLLSDEVIIRCRSKDNLIMKTKKYIEDISTSKLTFYKKDQEYFVSIDDVIFFETESNSICAHTMNDVYQVKYKLYELENILPKYFVRISKSTIVNINHIYSISKNIASSSIIEFNKTHKKVYVSRFYFKYLKEKLKERC